MSMMHNPPDFENNERHDATTEAPDNKHEWGCWLFLINTRQLNAHNSNRANDTLTFHGNAR